MGLSVNSKISRIIELLRINKAVLAVAVFVRGP